MGHRQHIYRLVQRNRIVILLNCIAETYGLINCRFADEKTRSKFLLYGGNDYQEEGGLIDYIDASLVPDFLGGPCKVNTRAADFDFKSALIPIV